jgi:hypothetical protein
MMSLVADDSNAMIGVLAADGPFPEWREELDLFGRLIGSWDIQGRFFDSEGAIEDEHQAEWHFGWVLEGRVIQDVLIRPARSLRTNGEPAQEYGTSLRVFEPRTGTWLVTWIAPVSARLVNLVARSQGEEISIEGPGPEGGLYRWTFSEISPAGFLWQGYQSEDDGANWLLGQEMTATRQTR